MLKRLPQFVLLAWALTVVGVRFVSNASAAPPTQAQLDLLKNGEAQRVGTLDGGAPITVTPGGAVYMVACSGVCTLCTFGSAVSSSLDGGCDTNTGETFYAGEKRFIVTGSSTTSVIPAAACNCGVYRMR